MSDAELFLRGRDVHPQTAFLLAHGKHRSGDVFDLLYFHPVRSTLFPAPLRLEPDVGGPAWLGRNLRLRSRSYGADGFPVETLVCGMGPNFNAFLDLLVGCGTLRCARPRDFGHFLCHLFRHIAFFDAVMCALGAEFVNVCHLDPAEAAKRVVLLVTWHLLNHRNVPDACKLVAMGVRLRYGGRAFVLALYQQCQMPFARLHRSEQFAPLHTFPPLSRGSCGGFDFTTRKITLRPRPVRNAHYDIVYGSVMWWMLQSGDFAGARRLALSAKHLTYLFRAFFPEFIGCTHCQHNVLRQRNPWHWLTKRSHLKFEDYEGGVLLLRWRHSHSNQLVGVMPRLDDHQFLDTVNGWTVEPWTRIARLFTLSISAGIDEATTTFF